MKYLTFSSAVLAMLLFGQCKKRVCAGLPEGNKPLNATEVNSIPYKGNDSILFIENNVPLVLKSDTADAYSNKYTPNTDCDETVELEGRKTLFKDSILNTVIYHNQSVSSEDFNTSFITITYRNRDFGFPYSYLKPPIPTPTYEINGKTYTNVLRRKSANDSIYYSLEKGIIRIKLESGFILNLP